MTGMVSGIVSAGSRLAEALMDDTCIVSHQTGIVTDPVTGVVSPSYVTVYPTTAMIAAGNPGICKVQTFTNRELLKSGGEHEFIIQRYEVHLPIAAVGVMTNDQITVTASLNDPDLVGRVYRVVGLSNKSQATARRLAVEEMPS